MSVARLPIRPNESWRMDGCGPRCQVVVATFPGRRYPERLPVHDPATHEAYGEHVLAPESGGVIARGITRTGGLVIDTITARASVDGTEITLTPIEWGLLAYLAANVGRVCSPVDVLRAVWGEAYAPRPARIIGGRLHHPDLHLIRTHLSRLRGKLGAARRLLEMRSGVGYLLLNEPVP